jgi:hypothetical protein
MHVGGNLTVSGNLNVAGTNPFTISISSNVTAIRALNTTYTNNTGKVMFISIHETGVEPFELDGDFQINSITIAESSIGPQSESYFGIALPGQTYRLSWNNPGFCTIVSWMEWY